MNYPIAVDFDGTIAEHEYPKIGKACPGVFEWLIKFQQAGAQLYLWTMRDDVELEEAVKFCKDNGVEFKAVNSNPDQKSWTDSPKLYAKIYIDDAAFGCPLITVPGTRPFVDWSVVGPEVLKLIESE